MKYQEGQLVMIQYYDDNSKVKTITTIGTRNGVKKDCYSIQMNLSLMTLRRYCLTDVSQLVNDVIYINKYERQWSLLYLGRQD